MKESLNLTPWKRYACHVLLRISEHLRLKIGNTDPEVFVPEFIFQNSRRLIWKAIRRGPTPPATTPN